MSYKTNTWTCSVLMCFLAIVSPGEEMHEQLVGVLGGSITFQLQISEEFKKIFWIAGNIFIEAVPTKSSRNECNLELYLPEFEGRLNASQDCKKLQLSDLKPKDSTIYKAEIALLLGKGSRTKTFFLQVYKNLSDSDLTIQCNRNGSGSGNGSFYLLCSVAEWEDGVNFTWAAVNMSESSGKALRIPLNLQDSGMNVTCTAKNPVGQASKMVSIRAVCAEVQAGSPQNESGIVPDKESDSFTAIAVIVPLVVLILVSVAVVVWWRWRQKKKTTGAHRVNNSASANKSVALNINRFQIPPPRRAPVHLSNWEESKETSKTIYDQIENLPVETPRQSKGKAKRDLPQTVYTTVHLFPKQNLLQTDDEKMQQEARGDAEKTIYSEVTKLQEDEQHHLRTLYDTVKNPQS